MSINRGFGLVIRLVVFTLCLFPARAAATENATKTSAPWTLMIYAAIDNGAESAFVAQASRMVTGRGVAVILLVDRSANHSTAAGPFGEDFSDTRLYRLIGSDFTRVSGASELPEIGLESTFELDTADPNTLRRFIRFGKKFYPARRYCLVLYGQAGGQDLLPDDQSAGTMGVAEMSDGLTAEESVDLAVLDLSAMGGIEAAYQWRPGSNRNGFSIGTLVATPCVGEAMPWPMILARLLIQDESLFGYRSRDFAKLIVDETRKDREYRLRFPLGETERQMLGLECSAAYDLTRVATVKHRVDDLASALYRHQCRETVEMIRGPADSPNCLHYMRRPVDHWINFPHFDLYDFALRVGSQVSLSEEVRLCATAVCSALDGFVLSSFGMFGLRGFRPGKSGVYITYPYASMSLPPAYDWKLVAVTGLQDDQDVQDDVAIPLPSWKSYSWYGPTRGEPGARYGHYAWCADGAQPGNGLVENWFELLDAWYDDSWSGDGGANGYRW